MRKIILAFSLVATGCAAPQAAWFQNPANGKVVKACDPAPGLAIAVEKAQNGCIDAYRDKGWIELSGPRAERDSARN